MNPRKILNSVLFALTAIVLNIALVIYASANGFENTVLSAMAVAIAYFAIHGD